MIPRRAVTCCGLVGSAELPVNVFPFILRGIRLIGIDSAEYPMENRTNIWEKISRDWKPDALPDMVDEIGLERLDEKISSMLNARLKRRILVKLQS
ncbi:hypothetical protein EGM51_14495 [Verrucomicrobia bacterium S94]|nr:hypothetical protein EGM51_14495 [Verrucomicrobia bacterium S94]